MCHGMTSIDPDPALSIVAGQCMCKRFTDGKRCEVCTDGYWNLTSENPDGCQGRGGGCTFVIYLDFYIDFFYGRM